MPVFTGLPIANNREQSEQCHKTHFGCHITLSPFICLQRLDFTTFNTLADPDFCFYDDTLLESVKVGDAPTHEFFRVLSLCHTVMSEEKSEGEPEEEGEKSERENVNE